MSLWILDTDHVSLLLVGHPQISRRVTELGSDVAITVVTVQELFNGWVVQINNAREAKDFVRLYGKFSRTITLCKRVPIKDFDQVAGDRYQQMLMEIPSLSKRRLQKDLRIVAIALSVGATVVTRNYRDFSQIPGLLLENWTQ
ncbi:MAG: type II toxin-antitoxin system VapC family toxin [Leptolyngbyaceae cyanobacterium SL_5_14]|nr:type II toxin-antitoxin system VapC family toxin [Leptolyngbyaceae cyanobacterium SL_5_14]